MDKNLKYPECQKVCTKSCFQCLVKLAGVMQMDDELNDRISREIKEGGVK